MHFKNILMFGGSNCGLNHFTSQPFVYKYWILSIPANNLSHVPRLHPIFFKSHIVQYVTESWGGLCSSMQKKSQYTTNKILQNWIKANNVCCCTMSFQRSLYTYSLHLVFINILLHLWWPLHYPHSNQLETEFTFYSEPHFYTSTHMQYGKCSHNSMRDPWNEANPTIGKSANVFDDRMLLCSLFTFLYPSFNDIDHCKQCTLRED